MVDDLECFVLVIFVKFMVTCDESGLSSQIRRFLGSQRSVRFLSEFFYYYTGWVRRLAAWVGCVLFKRNQRLLGASGRP